MGSVTKAEKGDKPGVPPAGYLNDRINKVIVADPELFPLIRTLWDKMLTGTYSIAELVRVADEELHIRTTRRGNTGGKPLAYSTLCMIFKNIYYTGKLSYKGEVFQGNQPAMITSEEFERVQQIIDPKRATRPKDKTLSFPLKGLLVCGECGFSITAEKKFKIIKKTNERREYIYYHCTGKNKQRKCAQPHLSSAEDELIRQIKEKISKFTIHPDFYSLAIEALAQEEDEVVAKDRTQTSIRDMAIDKKQQAINNLRRMRYAGEADDDSWYFAEMNTLEKELEDLHKSRNKAEYAARNWREIADETFTFARYAKEDFDSHDLEKKRTVIARLGARLELLDRTIQFTPNKYLVPIEEMNDRQNRLSSLVRTSLQTVDFAYKSKTTPVGSSAVLSKSLQTLGLNDLNSTWLRRLGSNQ